jgi:hypothetical protein
MSIEGLTTVNRHLVLWMIHLSLMVPEDYFHIRFLTFILSCDTDFADIHRCSATNFLPDLGKSTSSRNGDPLQFHGSGT